MKIAMLTPWDQKCGNAEYIKQLVPHFPSDVTIMPVEMPNLTGIGQSISDIIFLKRHMRRIVDQTNALAADVIHIQHEFIFFADNLSIANMMFLWLISRLKKPVVVSLHTLPREFLTRKKFKLYKFKDLRLRRSRRSFIKALKIASKIIVHSRDSKLLLTSTLPKISKKVIDLPIAVVPKIDDVISGVPKKPKDIWVVLAGFINSYKGHLHALETFRHLPERFKLVFVGGGHPKDKSFEAYWADILRKIDDFGLQNKVIVTGFLETRQEQAYYFQKADLFILPYFEVGQSGSAVLSDIAAYDAPAVTSDARSMNVYRYSPDTMFSSIALYKNELGNDYEAIAKHFVEIINGDYPNLELVTAHQENIVKLHSAPIVTQKLASLYALVASKKDDRSLKFERAGV